MLNVNLLKKISLATLPSVICISLFYILVYQPKNEVYQDKIKTFKVLNSAIAKENDSILKMVNYYKSDMDKMDEIIKSLYEENYILQNNLDSIKEKMVNLKEKYDKNRNHATNFNSNDIQRYFAELQ